MGVRFDETFYPVIIVRFPHRGTVAEIHDWYDQVESYLAESDGPLAFVDDLRLLDIGSANAIQRRTAATRHDGLAAKHGHKHAGNARVVGGHVAHAVLRVFDWLSPAPWPVATFQREDEAIAWCRDRVGESESGAATPPLTL